MEERVGAHGDGPDRGTFLTTVPEAEYVLAELLVFHGPGARKCLFRVSG